MSKKAHHENNTVVPKLFHSLIEFESLDIAKDMLIELLF